jgi:integration host factor subunit alpha
MSVTKADIIGKIHLDLGLSKKESSDLVDLVFKIVKDTLSRGQKVKITGFGNFTIRDKSTRVGRNPQTGSSMNIAARRVLTFRPSQLLKEDITAKYAHRMNDEGIEDKAIPPKEGSPRTLSASIHQHMDEDDE